MELKLINRKNTEDNCENTEELIKKEIIDIMYYGDKLEIGSDLVYYMSRWGEFMETNEKCGGPDSWLITFLRWAVKDRLEEFLDYCDMNSSIYTIKAIKGLKKVYSFKMPAGGAGLVRPAYWRMWGWLQNEAKILNFDNRYNSAGDKQTEVICPFCNLEYGEEIERYCEHFIHSGFPDNMEYLQWGKYDFVINIMKYINEINLKDFKFLTKGLKIKKYIKFELFDSQEDLEYAIRGASNKEIKIMYEHFISTGMNSAIYTWLFINDMKKVKWIFDDLKVVYDRILDYDQHHEKLL